jgi:dTDP-4-amino-4,6-dideoxygalactose transaminase
MASRANRRKRRVQHVGVECHAAASPCSHQRDVTKSSDSERHLKLDSEPTSEHADRIQVLRPLLPDAERLLSYLRRIDACRTYTNWGPLVSEFEARLAAHFDVPSGCVTSAVSGTGALVGAILASAGRAAADRPRAIIPAFTFVATALAAEHCGFRPHFVDVDADRWQLQPEALEHHPRLKEVGLVVPVAPFGKPVPQAPWVEFHRRTGIPVVIDGGASFEAVSQDPARLLGEIPVALSFHATKSFATAEGGCVIATDSRLSASMSRALNFGFFEARDCRAASTNGKMSEYHAAVGLAELDNWAAKCASLQEVAAAYRRRMGAAGLGDRLLVAPDVAGCYALFRCVDAAEATAIVDGLAAETIETRLWYGTGLHRQPYYVDASRDDLPVTDRIAPLTIGLPVASDLTDACIQRVVTALVRDALGYR